ncbi:hypothetical protein ES703_117329 [subsurface metagenome]
MQDANTSRYCKKDILWQSQGKTNLLSWMNTREILIKTENMPLGEYAPSLQLPKKEEKENTLTMAM